MQQSPFLKKLLGIIVIFILVVAASQLLNMNWGRLELGQPATLTVTGKADGTQSNQIATFYAGVTVDNVDRDTAIQSANTQTAALIEAVKTFGIPAEDIQTENISIYEYEDYPQTMIYPPTNPVNGQKTWQASNNITVTLRDLTRATELATVLANTGATTVSGPSFSIDDSSELDAELLQLAMQDAREKAAMLLEGSGQKITRIVNVYENESYYPYPMYRGEAAMDSVSVNTPVPVEPGSEKLTKSVTVVYEISR